MIGCNIACVFISPRDLMMDLDFFLSLTEAEGAVQQKAKSERLDQLSAFIE